MKITLTTQEVEEIIRKHLNCKLGIPTSDMAVLFNCDTNPFNPISVEFKDA